MADGRRASRAEKRKSLPWANHVKKKSSGSLWKYWAARCDGLWSEVIKARDRKLYGNICRIGKAKNCTGIGKVAYHIAPKMMGKAVRWLVSNGVLACSACNDGERKNRALYRRHHEELFGKAFVDSLHEKKHDIEKYDVPGLQELAGNLMKMLKENTWTSTVN